MGWIILLSAASLLCWGALGYVVAAIDPYASGWIGPMLFFASLSLALGGTITLATFGLRRTMDDSELPWRHLRASLREGIFFSLLGVFSLYLVSKGMLRWWNATLLAAAVVALDGLFLMNEYARRARRNDSLAMEDTRTKNNQDEERRDE